MATDPSSPSVAIAARDVAFAYGPTPVLRGVSFTVAAGTMVALAGANGSGKSTLLRVLLGLVDPTAGHVELLGSSPRRLRDRWRLGYVPQRPEPTVLQASVEEVVAAGLLSRRGVLRRLRPADREEIDHAVTSVGLDELRRRPVGELSGGQQQRAFIAKALVSQPDLLVLDEPVAGVDVAAQRQFRDAVVHLVRSHGGTVLLVSHELGAVADDLDQVVVLRRGTISFDGTPAELTASGVHLGIHQDDLPLWLERPDGSTPGEYPGP